MENAVDQQSKYMRNPDVVLREEDEDGALIYNPDTDQIKVINPTGLFIWQQCDGTRDLGSIVSAVEESYDEVPGDQVSEQVEKFIDDMVNTGFIGTVEE
jgi:coenzyme PQQ synthesis protein D (PqqD)